MKTFYVIKDFEEFKKDTIIKIPQEKALPLKNIRVIIPIQSAYRQGIIKETEEKIPSISKKIKKRRIKWQ